MVKSFLILAAAFAAAAPAQAAGPHYAAELAQARPAVGTMVVHDIAWRCAGAGCAAGRSDSRPLTDCMALARQVGALKSFAVEGTALPPDQLEKCNAAAH
ncbi:MAG: hypothetical protein QOG84_2671 [Sphingomonadales bacterium]|jgi:hypothetical protein|nr:hypothetical protein [Sphingomonadales bacterium]